MRLNFLYLLAVVLLVASLHCTSDNDSNVSSWVSPETDKSINLGDKITFQVKPAGDTKPDSIVYFVDALRMASSTNTNPVSVNSDSLTLGNKSLIAKIYKAGQAEEITTNITIRSALIPIKFEYTIVKTLPHDTASYTEGLEYHNGFLYESDGEYKTSSIRKVDPNSGKVIQVTPIKDSIFAEGIAVIDNKILMLTYREKIAREYDVNTLKLIREFPFMYAIEGWGMCLVGDRIYYTDSSNTIHILNKNTYQEEGYIEVYDQNGPVQQVNELEYINGQLYANIYQSERVIIINPKNGQVTGEIDFSNLYPELDRLRDNPYSDVLNGIAWDAKGKRLFVTGKKWTKMFQVVIK
ncbi:MAG: Glutamine cyclotransferase [Sphingobacteriales bacterium]|nr:Glutamine cyclotransferase [Sphingobacteriales bacterium]